ncbi:hypothetical protein EDD17DRAFT_1505591 [Pisolithus thermaeus]|nr:hypothetical protein EDD17DRAFT_1505591 [Pisolithus thermaeus]
MPSQSPALPFAVTMCPLPVSLYMPPQVLHVHKHQVTTCPLLVSHYMLLKFRASMSIQRLPVTMCLLLVSLHATQVQCIHKHPAPSCNYMPLAYVWLYTTQGKPALP